MLLTTKPLQAGAPGLQKTIRHQFGRMQCLFPGISNCDITIKKIRNGPTRSWLVAAKVDLPGEVLFAKEMAETSQKATEMVIADIESQLQRYHEQMAGNRQW
ncbi:MAG: HPF/RaiA family ribosome-associated protein [Candidatus Dadabacteria bacterium]